MLLNRYLKKSGEKQKIRTKTIKQSPEIITVRSTSLILEILECGMPAFGFQFQIGFSISI